MKVRVARTAGFCMGVRRALDIVFDAARPGEGRPENLCTLGELVHNRQALEALEALGVRSAREPTEAGSGTVVLRAHGAGPTVREEIRALGLRAVDATCPRVVRCQKAVESAASRGRRVVIAGDPDHAEVKALVDFAGGCAEVVSTVEQAREVCLTPPVTLVAQTTSNAETYAEIAAVLAGRFEGEGALEVVRSLCRSTEERQREATELARGVDAVVVVGGRHSANTCRLVEVVVRAGRRAIHVETAGELRPGDFDGVSTVGVTAGASTPAWVTERVVERLAGFGSPVRRAVRAAVDGLLSSNILLAAGAASVTVAAGAAAGFAPRPETLLISFTFIFWAYAANRAGEGLRAGGASSGRASFFHRHLRTMLVTAAVLSAGALALAFSISTWMGAALLGADVVAGLYSLRLLPTQIRLRDIPGSKDVLIALAWAFVAVALPHLTAPGLGLGAFAAASATAAGVFVLAFSAATSLALGDVQSDRLIGHESVAALVGRGRARALAAGGAALVALGAVAGTVTGVVSPAALGFAFAGGVVFLATLIPRRPGQELLAELTVQAALVATGPAALAATYVAAGL